MSEPDTVISLTLEIPIEVDTGTAAEKQAAVDHLQANWCQSPWITTLVRNAYHAVRKELDGTT